MPKKDQQSPQPNYDKVKSVEECEKKIAEAQKTVARKYKLRVQAEQAKRDMAASYNEQIKHLKEELDHELGVISGWEDRRRVLNAGGAAEEAVEDADAGAPIPQTALPPPPPPPAPASSPPVASAQPPPAPAPAVPMPPTTSFTPPPPPAPSPGGNGATKLVPFPKRGAA